MSITHDTAGTDSETLTTGSTASPPRLAQLDVSGSENGYQNTTGKTYLLTITGEDGAGNAVDALLPLPPANSASAAWGTDRPKLALEGGNRALASISSVATDAPELGGSASLPNPAILDIDADVVNYVRTDFAFGREQQTVRDGVQLVADYRAALDGQPYEIPVSASGAVTVRPASSGSGSGSTIDAREGQDVLEPDARRDLSDVANFVRVEGAGQITEWAWAWQGDKRVSSEDPTGNLAGAGTSYGSHSTGNGIGGANGRNLQAVDPVDNDDIRTGAQALEIAKRLLDSRLRPSVSGTATYPATKDVSLDDALAVDYPSRDVTGTYQVRSVTWTITDERGVTEVGWGTRRPDTAEVVRRITGGRFPARSRRPAGR